ncbi:MAG: bifunctional DNA primase/polymerase [Candidatus Brocadia sinica]|nr:bifunctional DNA primase/polymerase [Candidatus Brocadia sinica]
MQDTEVSICEDVSFSALRYAGFSWPIIPLHSIDHKGNCACGKKDCSSPGKHPKTKNGLKDATTDVEQIKKWWPKDSDLPSNIGIVTGGESGLVVVDVDGDEGFEALGEERVKDLQNESVPCVRTGRGFHYYFKSATLIKTKPGFVHKVDIKADGGYVVAPPSSHISGCRYEWLVEPNGELPEVPSWVFENQKGNEKKSVTKTTNNIIPEGQRNGTLFKLACSLRAKDVSYETALTTLASENQKRCNPPLSDRELRGLIDSAYERYEAGTIQTRDFNCTDLGSAKRFVARHGDKIRYCFAWKKWLVWDGKTWQVDDNGQILRLAKDTVKQIYSEASQISDESHRRVVAKWAIASEAENKLRAMISLSESEDGIPISPDQLDTNHYLLNCQNGTIDLRTGELKPHDPQDYITKIIPVE